MYSAVRKSLIVFVILTVVLFSIFSELLAIRKEAIFDEWAEKYVANEEEEITHTMENMNEEVSEYANDEIGKEFAYDAIDSAINNTRYLMESATLLRKNKYRKIPIIGIVDIYSNHYCMAYFTASQTMAFANSSGTNVELEKKFREEFTKVTGFEKAENIEVWNEFKKSKEYNRIIEQYYITINSHNGETLDVSYRRTLEMENPEKNSLSFKRIILDNCIRNYKTFNEIAYSNYICDSKNKDHVKATVDSSTVFALSVHYGRLFELDPSYTGMYDINILILVHSLTLLFTSIAVSSVIMKFPEKKIGFEYIGGIFGGFMSALAYMDIFFFCWVMLGAAITGYRSDFKNKKNLIITGFKVGLLAAYISYAVILVIFPLGLGRWEGGPGGSEKLFLYAILLGPILFILFSLIGLILGSLIKVIIKENR